MSLERMFTKLSRIDFICLLPAALFVFFNLPFWGEAPSLDPMVLYRESTQFFSGGIPEIIQFGVKVHPPLIYILNSIFFWIFGPSPSSYNLLGTTLLFLDSVVLYFVTKHVFNRKAAIAFALLFFCNPLVMVNFFHLGNDTLVVSGIIAAFSLYVYHRLWLLALFLPLMILMKETALVVVGAVLLVYGLETIFKKEAISEKLSKLLTVAAVTTPTILGILAWRYYLSSLGTTEWRDLLFTQTNDSSYMIVLKNIITGNIFNKFMNDNLRNTFILNFNWIYSSVFLLFTASFGFLNRNFLHTEHQKRYFYSLFVIALMYMIMVFSFPTWTPPRYGIPVLFCVVFFCSLFLSFIRSKIAFGFFLGLWVEVLLLANQGSYDPFSHNPKNKDGFIVQGEKLYDIDFWNSGPDRHIYNQQHLRLTQHQNAILADAISKDVDIIVTYCDELKLGEKGYSIGVHNEFYPALRLKKPIECINDYALDKEDQKKKIEGKRVYLRRGEDVRNLELISKNGIHISSFVVGDQ